MCTPAVPAIARAEGWGCSNLPWCAAIRESSKEERNIRQNEARSCALAVDAGCTPRSAGLSADQGRVSVRRIYPPRRENFGSLLIKTIGGFFAYLVAYAAVLGLFAFFSDSAVADVFVAISLVTAIAGVYVWLRAYAYLRRALIRLRRRRRYQRLQRLAARAGAPERLPHRYLEWILMKYGRGARMHAFLATVQPGWVIMTMGPKQRQTAIPEPAPVSFEPIEVATDGAALEALDEMCAWYRDGRVTAIAQAPPTTGTPGKRLRRHIIITVSGIAGWFVLVAAAAVVAGSLIRGVLHLALILLLLFAPVLLGISGSCRVWLVPGALAAHYERRFRREGHVALHQPHSASLLLDAPNSEGLIIHPNGLTPFGFCEGTEAAVTAGWLSQAPTPTLDQLHCLFGYGDD